MEFYKDQQMPITRKFEGENLVVTVLSGQVSHYELQQSLDELPKIAPNLYEWFELVVCDHDLQVETSNKMNKIIFNMAVHVFNKFEKATISVVCPTDKAFRLARRLETNIVNEKIDVSVFRTEETARKWIDEIRSFHNGIDKAFHKKHSENPEVCFELSADSYENAKRLLNFSKFLVTQKHFSPATAVATLGTEEAIKAYELLFSSLNHGRQKALSLYLGNPIKKHNSVEPVQQSAAIFEIILQLVDDLIDKYKNDPSSDISELLPEIPSLIKKRLLEEKMTMTRKN